MLSLDRLEWQPVHPRAVRRLFKESLLVSLFVCVPLTIWFGWRGLSALLVLDPMGRPQRALGRGGTGLGDHR